MDSEKERGYRLIKKKKKKEGEVMEKIENSGSAGQKLKVGRSMNITNDLKQDSCIQGVWFPDGQVLLDI